MLSGPREDSRSSLETRRLDADDADAGANDSPVRLHVLGHRAVEVPHTFARVQVSPRVGARRRAPQPEQAQRDVLEVEERYALLRPVRRDEARVDAPQLLRVRAEEAIVERASEARDDPVLEAAFGRGAPAAQARPHVAEQRLQVLPRPQIAYEVRRLERVTERASFVQHDASPLLLEEIVAEHLLDPL